MSSGGHRGFTVVTIITLIFAPFFAHHQWAWRLVGETKSTHVEQCAPRQLCPQQRTVVNIVREPTPQGGGDQGGGNQGDGDQGGQGASGNEGGGNQGGGDQGGHGGSGGQGGGGDHGGKGKR